MGTAADLPPYCLGHRTRTDPRGSFSEPFVHHYELWPITIPRPARGRTKTAIVCGTCGRSYSCKVASRARMRRVGRRKRAIGLAAIIAMVGCITAVVILAVLISPGMLVMLGLTPGAANTTSCGRQAQPCPTSTSGSPASIDARQARANLR